MINKNKAYKSRRSADVANGNYCLALFIKDYKNKDIDFIW